MESEEGVFLENMEDIERETWSFFQKLYEVDNEFSLSIDGIEWGSLNEEKSSWLERPCSLDEVKAAIFSCGREKSQVQMVFFEDCWNFLKEDLLKVFEEFFSEWCCEWEYKSCSFMPYSKESWF